MENSNAIRLYQIVDARKTVLKPIRMPAAQVAAPKDVPKAPRMPARLETDNANWLTTTKFGPGIIKTSHQTENRLPRATKRFMVDRIMNQKSRPWPALSLETSLRDGLD